MKHAKPSSNGSKVDQTAAFHSNFARLAKKTSREEAIATVKADLNNASGWYALGRLLALEGEKEKARDCFTRAVALDSSVRNRPGLRRRSAPTELPDWL